MPPSSDYYRQLLIEYERDLARQARLRERKYQRAFYCLLPVTGLLALLAVGLLLKWW